MTIEIARTFLMWCSLVNVGLMLFSFAAVVMMGDFIYRMHSKWFPMSRETFNVMIYGYLGLFKILIIVFNIAPLIALCIIGNG